LVHLFSSPSARAWGSSSVVLSALSLVQASELPWVCSTARSWVELSPALSEILLGKLLHEGACQLGVGGVGASDSTSESALDSPWDLLLENVSGMRWEKGLGPRSELVSGMRSEALLEMASAVCLATSSDLASLVVEPLSVAA
jgi:hypothetical protein